MMTSKNTRRYWGLIGPVIPAGMLAQSAKQLEDMGLEGTFAAQVYGPPWISLAAAATATNRLKLASGVALAFTRSPFETAMAAMDLDRISGGRLILGLCPTVRSWCQGIFGMPTAGLWNTCERRLGASGPFLPKTQTVDLKDLKASN